MAIVGVVDTGEDVDTTLDEGAVGGGEDAGGGGGENTAGGGAVAEDTLGGGALDDDGFPVAEDWNAAKLSPGLIAKTIPCWQ